MIRLNSYDFDEEHASVVERLEEVGGRDARVFVISGVIVGKTDLAAVEDELDRILDEASRTSAGATLQLREGRQFQVERLSFEGRPDPETPVGMFELKLSAPNPFEVATTSRTVNWNVTTSGQTLNETAGGNVESLPKISITASGDLVNPKISDGERSMEYSGTVADGETLVFDGGTKKAELEGEDVLPYVMGDFPVVLPEGTMLVFTDDPTSSHQASIVIEYRDRWW